ncbi:MAG: MFS transporter [Anaerolinea sp.]|nr:MFS transporter [Anaerolinea sp.]
MPTTKYIQQVYYLATSLYWFATALPIALITLLFQARGFSLFEIGLAFGVYSATIVLLEVPTGGLADVVGRKRVALLAYCLMALMSVVWLLAFSLPVLILAMILYGMSRALSSGALDAWFVDAVQNADPDVDLQPLLAKAGTFTLLALGLGALLGSAIPQMAGGLPAEGTAVLTPLSLPILVSIILKGALIIFVAGAVHEERPSGSPVSWTAGLRATPQVVGEAFALTRQSETIPLLLGTTAAAGLALAAIETFWQPHMADLLPGASHNTILFGLVMTGSFLTGMAGNILATPLSRRLGGRYALVAALVRGLQGLFLLMLALQTAVPGFILFFWLVYLNLGVLNSPHSTLLNAAIPAARRSAMLSVESLTGYLGAIIGSIGLGYVAQQQSISAAWIVAAVGLMVSLFLYVRIDRLQRRQTSDLHISQQLGE